MKRIFILPAICFFLVAPSAFGDDSVLSYERFEPPADSEILPGWAVDKATFSVSRDVRYEGDGAARLVADSKDRCTLSGQKRVGVKPGEFYVVSARVKVRRGFVQLLVEGHRDGKSVGRINRRPQYAAVRDGEEGDWVLLQTFAEVPKDVDSFSLVFSGTNNADLLLDDLLVTRRIPPRIERKAVRGFLFDKNRVDENPDRGLIVRAVSDGVYLGWRLLESDPKDVAFHVDRSENGESPKRLNERPIAATTDFMDKTAEPGVEYTWSVYPVSSGRKGDTVSRTAKADRDAPTAYISIPVGRAADASLEENYTFQKFGVGDLDGDGCYDFVLKTPNENVDPWYVAWKKSPATYKLDAYDPDGRFLWRHDLGWSIEQGIWYSPYVVYDFDGDGKAEIAVKTGEGDPRGPDGRVRDDTPEFLSVLDGSTGKIVAKTDWLPRRNQEYSRWNRNQIGIAHLDGKTPCIVIARGTYDLMQVAAYQFHDGRLEELWRWTNEFEPGDCWGQGAHIMHAVDLDDDGRDEIVLGSIVLDDDGSVLWTIGLGHPDYAYVGNIDPSNPGLEIHYGIETAQRKNGICLVVGATGRILWGHPDPTRHIHGSGLCADLDAEHPGMECYGAEQQNTDRDCWMRDCRGSILFQGSDRYKFKTGQRTVWWTASPQKEIIYGDRIRSYPSMDRIPPKIEGSVVAILDLSGDWREEIVTSLPGEIRIYTTTIPAETRNVFLMQDPLYRKNVAEGTMGYYQNPFVLYDMSTGKR